MKDLNSEFAAMKNGKMDFLWRYPMTVDPQVFGFVKGDKETFNPMMGVKQPHRTQVTTALTRPGTDGIKDKHIQNKTVPLYADFDYADSAAGNKMRVAPTLHLINFGGHCVKLFYLPWKEDKMHTMVIDEQADFFMTASMHGCRFVMKDFGNGMLSVSHANVQPGPGIDAQAQVLKLIKGDTALAPTALSYGKDKYFADAQRLIHGTRRGLMPLGIRPQDVKSAEVDTYLANVVGVRSGSSWRFYCQLTCIVDAEMHGTTTKYKYFGRFGRQTVDVVKNVKLDVVLKVSEIWPEESTLYVI